MYRLLELSQPKLFRDKKTKTKDLTIEEVEDGESTTDNTISQTDVKSSMEVSLIGVSDSIRAGNKNAHVDIDLPVGVPVVTTAVPAVGNVRASLTLLKSRQRHQQPANVNKSSSMQSSDISSIAELKTGPIDQNDSININSNNNKTVEDNTIVVIESSKAKQPVHNNLQRRVKATHITPPANCSRSSSCTCSLCSLAVDQYEEVDVVVDEDKYKTIEVNRETELQRKRKEFNQKKVKDDKKKANMNKKSDKYGFKIFYVNYRILLFCDIGGRFNPCNFALQ